MCTRWETREGRALFVSFSGVGWAPGRGGIGPWCRTGWCVSGRDRSRGSYGVVCVGWGEGPRGSDGSRARDGVCGCSTGDTPGGDGPDHEDLRPDSVWVEVQRHWCRPRTRRNSVLHSLLPFKRDGLGVRERGICVSECVCRVECPGSVPSGRVDSSPTTSEWSDPKPSCRLLPLHLSLHPPLGPPGPEPDSGGTGVTTTPRCGRSGTGPCSRRWTAS